jgi:RND family efflux transporter MFP subunit
MIIKHMIIKIAGPGVRNSVALLMGLAWAFFASACSSENESKTLTLETFPVVHPTLLDTVYTKEYVAQIQSIQNVELRARINGFIDKIHVDEGKTVQAGQLLFTIANQQLREDLLKADAQLKNALAEAKVATMELNSTRTLAEKNIVGQSVLEMAEAKAEAIRAKIDEARSAVSSAKLNIAWTQVKAPFSGIINRIPNKTGSLVEEGTLLTTISDNKEVFAYFNVSEKEYLDNLNKLEKGDEVTLLMANNQAHAAKGKIETVESEIDKNTGSIAFRARFPNPTNCSNMVLVARSA